MVPLWLNAEESMPEFAPDLRLVLNLVSRSACTAYDCEFAAVASERGMPLVSADQQLPRAFPAIAISLAEFVDR
jgi:predicted nucleic acid-binding protein